MTRNPASNRRTLSVLFTSAAAVGSSLLATSRLHAAPPVIDGTLDAGSVWTPFAIQTVQTGFGDNQSELDAGYMHIENGKLHVFLAGNLESNFNKMVLFFDTRAGGQNVMRGDNPNVDFNNLNTRYQGMTFDAGFSPDYTLFYSRDANNVFVNFSELNTNGGGLGGFVGQVATPNPSQQGSGVIGGTGGLPKIEFAYSDANTAGVSGGNAAADQTAAAAVTTGSEFSIDLSQIGATENFQLMVGINGSNHDFWSNQFLPGVTPPQGNLGSDGMGNFVGPGSVSAVNFDTMVPGNQFLTINYHAPLSHWSNAGNGNWSELAKWTNPDGVPNAPDARALLDTTAGSAARTITLDANVSLELLVFDSAGGYTIAPSGTNVLTIAGNPATPAINVLSGSHTIAAPLTLGATTNITVAAGSALNVTGNLTAAGQAIIKDGAGSVQFQKIVSSSLNVLAGTVKISAKGTANSAAGTSVVNGLAISGGATLDLANNSMVIDYTDTPGTLVDDVRQHLQNGRLKTSALTPAGNAVGYGDNAVLNKTTFGGVTVDASSLLIKYTYGGDSNLDGQVDVTDLGALATSWQTSAPWTGGDFNYDGFVDVSDLGILATNWQKGVGNPLGPGSLSQALAEVGLSGVTVPEPATIGMIGVAAIAAVRRRRSPRQI